MPSFKCPGCGLVNFASATSCKRCQLSFDPASPHQQTPSPDGSSSQNQPASEAASGLNQPAPPKVRFEAGVRRAGDLFVVTEESILPNRCVKCNAPAERQIKRKVIWMPLYVDLIAFLSPIIGLILMLFKRESATIYIGLCQKHFVGRFIGVWVGGGMLAAGMLMGFLTALNGDYWLLGYGGVSALIGAFLIVLLTPTVTADRIEKPFVWLKGAHPDFLNALPTK